MIPTEKLEVDPMNPRYGVEFGDDELDEMLVRNLESVGQLEPLIVRKLNSKYGIISGSRRFLAGRDKFKEFPCIVKEVDDAEAIKIALSTEIGTKKLSPIQRARAYQLLLDTTNKSLSAVAREIGVPKSTLSEWLSFLKLTGKMQKAIDAGVVREKEAKLMVRMRLSEDLQNDLAEKAFVSREAFEEALNQLGRAKERRGAPKGLFVVRIVLPPTLESTLSVLSSNENKSVGEYVKDVLIEHLKGLGFKFEEEGG